MKKIIAFLLAIMLICSTSNALYYFEGGWNETECDICNKTLYEWYKGGYNNSEFFISSGGRPYYDGEEKISMGIDMQVSVCQKCYAKHSFEYRQVLLNAYKEWINQKALDYKDIREENQEKRKLRKIKQKRDKIKKWEEEIQKLNKE